LIGQAKVAAARAQSLRSSLDKLKGTQATANMSDVKLQELERDAQASRVLLEQMLGRYADVNARQDLSLQPGFARVIQKAVPMPSSYFPKPGPIMALTSFAGLALGLGLAFLFSVMSASSSPQTTTSKDETHVPPLPQFDLEDQSPAMDVAWPASEPAPPEVFKVPPVAPAAPEKTLAVLSTMPSAANLSATLAMVESTYGGAQSAITDAANRIASSFLTLKEVQGLNSVALTSIGGRGMDASLATVAVTRALAAAKKKVIAVDLSSLNSPFETMFELAPGCGISDLVAGDADFTKVICRDPHSPAHLIRYGLQTAPHFPATITEKLAPIFKALAGIYDLVLVHVGEASPATPALVKECKGTLLLAPQSRYRDAVAAARVLADQGGAFTMFVRLESGGDTQSKHAASA
jgi:polysaccharide biosynthesis transport protein